MRPRAAPLRADPLSASPLRVAFRADASVEIGSGHVMRCLTLARALRERGAECRFITRELPGNLIGRIEAEGYELAPLPPPAPGEPPPKGPPPFAHWAGVAHTQDAAETRAAMEPGADWLVMDHYALDARWQRAVARPGMRLMVIDDLADRPHDCDLLLDQTLGRSASEYDTLVPALCLRLIGPQYALLRPEFAARRAASLQARAGRAPRRLLVLMGGMDAENTVSDVLQGLRMADLPRQAQVTIVMGSRSPHLESVRRLAGQMPYATQLRIDVTDMAALMAESDLAISASGLVSYELMCMGVPSLLVPMWGIQEKVAREMCRMAEARVAEHWREAPAQRIGAAARAYLADLADLTAAARAGTGAGTGTGAAVDGLGTARVGAAMLERTGRA